MFLSVYRSLLMILCFSLCAPISTHAEESPPVSPAKLLMQIIDTVVEHHIEAPTRQQMVLDAIRFVADEQGKVTPPGLSQQVSSADRATLLRLLHRALPPSPFSRVSNAGDFDRIRKIAEAIVPGGISMTSQAEHRVQEQLAGNRYVGIGVQAGMHDPSKQLKFMRVVPGGAAKKAGARDGDIVETVDGQPTQGKSIGQVIQWLRGEEGTDVTVTLRQPNEQESREYTMTRAVVPFKQIEDPRYSNSKRVVAIRFKSITGSAVHDLRKIEQQLPETVEIVTLDFRGQSGNNLQHGIQIANALLDGQPIGQVESTHGLRKITAEPGALFGDRKLIIMTDSGTQGTPLWIASAVNNAGDIGEVYGRPSTIDVVREGIPLEGNEFVIQIPTARLRKVDGSPLVPRSRSRFTHLPNVKMDLKTRAPIPQPVQQSNDQDQLRRVRFEDLADEISRRFMKPPISDEPKE